MRPPRKLRTLLLHSGRKPLQNLAGIRTDDMQPDDLTRLAEVADHLRVTVSQPTNTQRDRHDYLHVAVSLDAHRHELEWLKEAMKDLDFLVADGAACVLLGHADTGVLERREHGRGDLRKVT